MHFDRQTLTNPGRLKPLLAALGLNLWLPKESSLLRGLSKIAQSPEPSRTKTTKARQLPAMPTGEPGSKVAFRAGPKPSKEADKVLGEKQKTIIGEDGADAEEARTPKVKLVLARIPGLVWVFPRSTQNFIEPLLQEIAFFKTGNSTLKLVPFTWPQPLPVSFDQSDLVATQAFNHKVRNLYLRSSNDHFVAVGKSAQDWLLKCNFDLGDLIEFQTPEELTDQPASKRRIWQLLIEKSDE